MEAGRFPGWPSSGASAYRSGSPRGKLGVSKAALEAISRYLARYLGSRGVRVNLVSAGPLKTLAASGVPSFDLLAERWGNQAPLGWDGRDATPVAHTVCFLLSEWARAITGEIIHVDGGFHAMGTPLEPVAALVAAESTTGCF